jgi:dihydropyrimidinase
MDTLVGEGVPDFKLFTAYPGVFYSDDGAIFRAMQQTAKNGGLIMMHAENGMAIDVVAAERSPPAKTDPYYHGVARYPIFEGEATNRVIRLAEAAGVPVYIVHLSARDALDEPSAGARPGVRAFAETCPQYLFLSLDDMGNGFEGAKFVCSPPLRRRTTRPSCGPGSSRTTSRSSRPTTARSTSTARRSWAGRLPQDPERPAGRRGPARPDARRRRRRWPLTPRAVGRDLLDGPGPDVRAVPAQGRRGAIGSTRTSWSTTRTASTRSAPTHHMDVDYSCYEGRASTWATSPD